MREQILKSAQLLWRFTHVRRFEDAVRAPRAAQEQKLRAIVAANRDTVYGREHGFGGIRTVADFRRQVPINDYERLEPYVQRSMRGERHVLTREAPLMFAVTSGTTGKSKFIPVTPSYLAEYNHAVHVHTWRLLADYPEAGGGTFLIPSSCDVEGHTEAGIPYGAISGFLTRQQPSFVRTFYALPYEVARIKSVEAKYYLTLLLALQHDIRLAVSVNPSSLVLLAEKMQAHAERLLADLGAGRVSAEVALPQPAAEAARRLLRPQPERARQLAAAAERHGALTPKHAWPDLKVISCWKGGTMPLYLQRLRRFWGEAPVRDLGYMASEGRGSIPLVDAGAAGVLALTTHFFEFVPVDEIDAEQPTCLTADELVSNREYYVLFTTSSGLYRYHINDIVRVVDYYREAPVIQFVRKGQGISSVTGEKLTESQVTASLLDVVAARKIDLKHFAMAPRWAATPYYALMVEPGGPTSAAEHRDFLRSMDQALCEANVEYQAKRESERLGRPVLQVVAPGTFDRYRQERVSQGAPEAQVKIPHLSPKFEFGKQFEVVEEIRLDATPVAGGGAGG